MKVIIFGATGMVGSEVLKHCIANDAITSIVTIGRNKSTMHHDKLTQVVISDFLNYSQIYDVLSQANVCIYCLGVYQNQVSKESFWAITVDYLRALVEAFETVNKSVRFCLFSAQGAVLNGKSLFLFARIKGAAEKILLHSAILDRYIFRPGYIRPTKSAKQLSRLDYIFIPIYVMFPFIGINTTDLAQVFVHVGIYGYNKVTIENKDLKTIAHMYPSEITNPTSANDI